MSSRPESSSSTPRFNFDVFLSFRGEDTRKNFTYCLYIALGRAGIHTFRDDDDLSRGKEITPQLIEAIRKSRIFIVIFSKGYAFSTWCLVELAEILHCKNTSSDQIVLPVFYDIDPSDVRKQKGSFAEAFDRHEKHFKEDMEKVNRWREALVEAGNIHGWVLKDVANRHESEFIQNIVEDVLNKLDRKAKYPVGIELEWTLLITNLLLEGISAIFDQLGYVLLGMVVAFIALILSIFDIVYFARKERIRWDGRSLLPCFRRRSALVTSAGKPFGTVVEYFGLVGAVWQCFYSTMQYAYARQNKDNPIKMCLLPFLFVVSVVIAKLINQKAHTKD